MSVESAESSAAAPCRIRLASREDGPAVAEIYNQGIAARGARREKHGRLDGRWLDVVIVERLIPENQP